MLHNTQAIEERSLDGMLDHSDFIPSEVSLPEKPGISVKYLSV